MTHPLQTILFGTFTPPPSTNTISHRLWKDTHPTRHLTPLGATTLSIRDALTGNKWWSIADLMDYLKLDKMTVYNTLTRHGKKFGIQSYVSPDKGYKIKYFRIAPNVPS